MHHIIAKEYLVKKDSGNSNLILEADEIFLKIKVYSTEDGTESSERILPIEIGRLDQEIEQKNQEIADLEALKVDCEALIS